MKVILHRKFGLAICLALMLSLTLSGVVLAAAYPCNFHGTVKVDGVAVPDGTAITAWAENLSTHVQEQVGVTTTVSTPVAGFYGMTVSLDSATHSTTIYFKVGAPWNQWANETGTWVMYGGKELNLTVGLVVAFSAATYSVGEGGGSATITVNLSEASAEIVTVHYATSDGTATAGLDYTAASGTLTFSAGDISEAFIVSIVDDGLVESDETVNLALTSPTNATLGTPSTAVLTIVDNELNADFTASPLTGVAPLRVSFTNLSSGADEWVWEFGDGGTSTAQNPTHTYIVPGIYTVTLTATGPSGSCEETKERYIRVLATAVKGEPPKLTATWLLVSPEQVLPNQEVLISINIGNQGGSDGSRTVALFINGYLEQSQTVVVSPGATQNVVFRVTKSTPGTYQVSLEGKEGQFTVIALPEAPTTNYFPGGLGTGGIIVIIVVVIVLIVAVVFLVRRQTLT